MGDRIVVLNDGVVQQIAPPLDLYNHPANRFVAGFIGSPAMNFVDGRVDGDTFTSAEMTIRGAALADLPAGEATLGVRPEDIYLDATAPQDRPMSSPFALAIDVLEPMGNEVFVYAATALGQLVARVDPQPLPEAGRHADWVIDLDRIHMFDATTGETLAAVSTP